MALELAMIDMKDCCEGDSEADSNHTLMQPAIKIETGNPSLVLLYTAI